MAIFAIILAVGPSLKKFVAWQVEFCGELIDGSNWSIGFFDVTVDDLLH